MSCLADKLDATFSKYWYLWDVLAASLIMAATLAKIEGGPSWTLTHLERPMRGHNSLQFAFLNALSFTLFELIWFIWGNQQVKWETIRFETWDLQFLHENHRNWFKGNKLSPKSIHYMGFLVKERSKKLTCGYDNASFLFLYWFPPIANRANVVTTFDPMVSAMKWRPGSCTKSPQICYCLWFVKAIKTSIQITFQLWLPPCYLMPLRSLFSLNTQETRACPTILTCNLPRRASAYLTTLRSLMRGLGCNLLEPI